MKIKEIDAKQLKGRAFNYKVAPVTIFLGPSFSGKTAVLDAVRLALLGYNPKLGKRGLDTMKLADGPEMQVQLTFEDDGKTRIIKRSWAKGRQGVGASFMDIPPAMLDIRDYFAMTGPERMKYVFGQIDLGDAITEPKLLARIRALRPEASGEHVEGAIAEALTTVADLCKAQREEDVSWQELVTEIIAAFSESHKQAKEGAKQFEGLARGSTQLKAEENPAPARSVDAPLAAARSELAVLNAELAQLDQAAKDNERVAYRIKDLKVVLARLPDDSGAIEKLRTEIAKLKGAISKGAPSVGKLYNAVAGAKEVCTVQKENLKRRCQEYAEAEAKYKANLQLKCCPFCRSKAKGWKDQIREEWFNEDEKQLLAIRETEKAIESWKVALAKHEKALGEGQLAEQQWMKQNGGMAEKLNKLNVLIQSYVRRAELEAELKGFESYKAQDVPIEKRAHLIEDIGSVAEKIVDLEAEQRRFIAAKANEAQLMKAKAAHGAQVARAEVFKMAVESIRGLQQEMIDKAIGALLGVANKFTEGILRGPLEYRDGDIGYMATPELSNAEAFHLARKQDRDGGIGISGQWVTHETFSGTETALAYAGLSVALAQQSPFKLVMIDELGIIDRETKFNILSRMIKLEAAGVINQFFGCDVTDDGWTCDTLKMVKVQ